MRIKIFRIILFTFCIGFILISCGKSSKEVFRIDSLNDSCWQSSLWISVANAPVVKEKVYDGTRAADGTSWFMSTVKNDKKVSRALWMTTGLGVYEIYVNGKLVGDEILKPGFTHYEKTKLSFTYDVTGCFKTASGDENVLSAQVTPGWWADKIITPGGHDGMIGKKCAFRGVLELTYTDGSKELYGTNIEDWKAGIAGPVTHAAIFDGEEYDARIPLGYETPEKLSTPEVNNEFKGEIFPSDGAEVYFRQDLSLAPVNAYIWESVEGKNENDFGKIVIKRKYNAGEPMEINPGENLVIDFGQNTAAVPSFIFSAAEGTVLNCVTSELLNDGNGAKDRGMDGPEGSVHRLNLRIPDTGMKLKYIFADSEGDVNYTPRCTFFGYRFISINVSDKVVIKDIKSLPVTSISKEMEIGCIKTGNELVNKLISNTLWGQRSNYLSIPTDCPQRNERLGWTADTQVFAETGSFFANTSSFFHKWMRDLIDSQGETGGFPGVAPLSQYGNDMTRLGWSDAGVIVPWTIWKQFGDKEIVELSWDAMEKYMSHINETRYDHNTLIGENGNYQWADWLSYEPLERKRAGYVSLQLPMGWRIISLIKMLLSIVMVPSILDAAGEL
jgi:alpha-L-rhamnosidase